MNVCVILFAWFICGEKIGRFLGVFVRVVLGKIVGFGVMVFSCVGVGV